MKQRFLIGIIVIGSLFGLLVNSCKKDKGVFDLLTGSLTEEFTDFTALSSKGWVMTNNSPLDDAEWGQGTNGPDKGGVWHGFPAYSGSDLEFAFASIYYTTRTDAISSWLISPVIDVKNGDKVSFYTRAEVNHQDGMQVLINKSTSIDVGADATSVGDFTTILFDINPTLTLNGYPQSWTKYEHIFSGITGKIKTRVAFRYFVSSSNLTRGIGIDQFRFKPL